MSFWERIEIGRADEIGSYTFEAEAIKRFAGKFDPQPFHLDEALARTSVLGGLCASGWHTAAVYMRLNVDHRYAELRRWVEAGHAAPKVGPSPGVTDLLWPKPVYAGDRVTFTQVVTDKRVSGTRPGWGVVSFATTGLNQQGEKVFSLNGAAFMGTE